MNLTPYEQLTFNRLTETMHNTRGLRKLIPIQRRDDDTVIMVAPTEPTPPRRYWEFNALRRRLESYRNQGVNYA